MPQAVDVSAYRIVQEALTNARVHAPGARVSIELTYRPAMLVLRIADDGPGPAGSPSNGHGLVGMRERALALGGWFKAGAGPAGGFLIQAGLPWNDLPDLHPSPSGDRGDPPAPRRGRPDQCADRRRSADRAPGVLGGAQGPARPHRRGYRPRRGAGRTAGT
ncbi:sensor histidine kinase [Streptosporangium lutulentum]